MSIAGEFSGARHLVNEMERHLLTIEARLQKPFWIVDRDSVQGARYSKPGINHYFVLALAKMVSGLNATLDLLEAGYLYEHGLLVRSVLETESKLSYVMAGVGPAGLDKVTAEFLVEYFADNERSPDHRKRYVPIRQADIHKRVSASVTVAIKANHQYSFSVDLENDLDQVATLHSRLYNLFSNYVHGRYPESMDLFDQHDRSLCLAGGVVERDGEVENYFMETLADNVSKNFRGNYLKLIVHSPTLIDNSVIAFAMGPEHSSMVRGLADGLRARHR